MAKAPNYPEMSLAELDEVAGPISERMQEIGLAINDDLSVDERLALEIERGELRAHLNIIQPLRVKFMVHEQRLRSAELQRQANMTDEEFAAYQTEMRALRQEVRIAGGPDGETLDPGVTTANVVSQ